VRFEFEVQVVEFFFDTFAGLFVLTRFVEEVVFTRVARFLVATFADAFPAARDQVGVGRACVQE